MGKLFEELKRRKVFKVGAVYAVVAWVLIQVADTVLPALQMPQWTVSFVTVLFFLGFPIAIVLAWAYEVTPTGIQPDTNHHSVSTVSLSSDRKLIYATFLLVLVAVGFQLVDRFVLVESSGSLRANVQPIPQGLITQLSVNLSDTYRYRYFNGGSVNLAFSPDGSQLVFGATNTDTREPALVRRSLSQRELSPIPGVEQSGNQFFSPDGESLAFFGRNELKRTTLDGRPPVTLTSDSDQFSKGLWKGTFIYFTGALDRRLMKVSVEGGPTQEVAIDRPELANFIFSLFEIKTTGQILLGRRDPQEEWQIILWDEGSGETLQILDDARLVAYVNAGYLIFVRDGTLMAARFNAESGQVGFAMPVLEGFDWGPFGVDPQVAVSESGTLGYVAAREGNGAATLNWVQADGSRNVLAELPSGMANVSLSPDGRLVAINPMQYPRKTYLWDMVLQVSSGIEIEDAHTPSWHPNGESLLFTRGFDLVSMSMEDQSEEILFSEAPIRPEASFYTPDGEAIIFHARDANSFFGIYALFSDEAEPRALLAREETHYINPAISPDGQWLAYQSGYSIYVTRFPTLTETRRVSVAPNSGYPSWRKDGEALFFTAGNPSARSREMQVVEADSVALERFAPPRTLFTISAAGNNERTGTSANSGAFFDTAEDGNKFLMVYGQDVNDHGEIVIVQNWAAELEHLLPKDRF